MTVLGAMHVVHAMCFHLVLKMACMRTHAFFRPRMKGVKVSWVQYTVPELTLLVLQPRLTCRPRCCWCAQWKSQCCPRRSTGAEWRRTPRLTSASPPSSRTGAFPPRPAGLRRHLRAACRTTRRRGALCLSTPSPRPRSAATGALGTLCATTTRSAVRQPGTSGLCHPSACMMDMLYRGAAGCPGSAAWSYRV